MMMVKTTTTTTTTARYKGYKEMKEPTCMEIHFVHLYILTPTNVFQIKGLYSS